MTGWIHSQMIEREPQRAKGAIACMTKNNEMKCSNRTKSYYAQPFPFPHATLAFYAIRYVPCHLRGIMRLIGL